MSKYSFEKMLPDDFESMVQALLEKTYRLGGNLIQFGPGPDGGREATWTQPPDHPAYIEPAQDTKRVPKEWVFQVKYHDIGQRGWTNAREAIVEDLERELDKIVHKYKVPCHVYVMGTNVPFTGVWNVGTRDQITAIAQKWQKHVSEIFVWDAADLSRMLDANEDVRTAYMDTILPGDILKALYKGARFHQDRITSAYRAYLQFVTEREGAARAEEAGDEPGLPLAEVFIDLTFKPHESTRELVQNFYTGRRDRSESTTKQADPTFLPKDFDNTPASFALLLAEGRSMLLLGGPGLGKSTLTQFVALYHAARVVDRSLAQRLAERLKLPEGISASSLDSYCRLRFPFRIELRRYARWMSDEQSQQKPGELARYIAETLVNPNVSSDLKTDDVFALAASDPLLLILDGLDEVPNPDTRKQILEQLQIFLRRVRAEEGDVQLLLSSRPKGYFGEFAVFEPLAWELNELEPSDFDDYCNRWLAYRIRDAEERREARDRIDRGMKSEAVQRLARSLLQA